MVYSLVVDEEEIAFYNRVIRQKERERERNETHRIRRGDTGN